MAIWSEKLTCVSKEYDSAQQPARHVTFCDHSTHVAHKHLIPYVFSHKVTIHDKAHLRMKLRTQWQLGTIRPIRISQPMFELMGGLHTAPKPNQFERKTFGVSMSGIKSQREQVQIKPELLEKDVFYLFSHKQDKYVARKTDEDVVEIFEVIE